MNILYQASFFYLLSETLLPQSYLTDTEFAITLDLVEQLGIREFVYIGNNAIDSRIIRIVKKFSNAKIPSQYLSIWHANAYMYNQKFYSKMAVVFKENAVPYLRDITRLYAQNNDTYIMSKFTWLVFITSEDILANENFYIPYDCEFFVVSKIKENYYEIREIYNIKNNGFGLTFGTWNRNSGLNIINTKNFYLRRIDMKGAWLTEVVQKIHKCPKVVNSCGNMEIISDLGHVMNFRISEKVVQLNDPLVESISNLHDGDFYNEEQIYNQAVKKIGPLLDHRMRWFIKTPHNILLPDYYLRPFDSFIWLAILLSALGATVISLVINHYVGNRNKRSWIDNSYMALESICNQCGNDYVENISLRIVFIIIRITILLLMSSYGAVITSFLTVDKPELPFKNINEFLENGQYKLGIQFGSYEHATLLGYGNGNLKNELLRKVFNNYTVTFDNDTDGQFFEKFCSENIVVSYFKIESYRDKIRCNYFEIPQPIISNPMAIVLNKHSPFMDAFQIIFLRSYLEAGFRNAHQKFDDNGAFLRFSFKSGDLWIHKQFSVTRSVKSLNFGQKDNVYAVEFSQMYQVVLLPVLGIWLALLALTGERMVKDIKMKNLRKTILVRPLHLRQMGIFRQSYPDRQVKRLQDLSRYTGLAHISDFY